MLKMTPLGLDHGGPKTKFTYFHCFKNPVKWYVTCHGYLKNHQSYFEKLQINQKNYPFNRKKMDENKNSKAINF